MSLAQIWLDLFLTTLYFWCYDNWLSSVAHFCPTLCKPIDCSMPGFPVQHQSPELAQTHVHRVSDAIQTSSVVPFSSCFQSFPASRSLKISQLFASGGQSIGVSASTSVLPMNTQDMTEWLNWLISIRINWFDLLAVTGERNGKPLQYSFLENPMNSMKRQEGFNQFSSIAQSCLTLCDPMNHSMSGLPVHHQLPEFTQTHEHQVGDAIQPSHPL